MDERFLLEVPADPAVLSTVRLFVASLARHHRLVEERVEDLKLGVSEACSAVLAGIGPEEDRLLVTVVRDRDRLRFEVRGGSGSNPAQVDEVSAAILRSRFADARVVAGRMMTFSVGLDPVPSE